MAASSANGIIATILWSTLILGEKFILRYDLPALILIQIGCLTICLIANTKETTFSEDEVKELLKAPRTLTFFIFTVTMIIVCLSIINLVLKRLRLFEKDVDDYENDNTDDAEPV